MILSARSSERAQSISSREMGCSEISLIDKRFRDGEPAIINLNLSGLFDVVQDCRDAWEEALEA